MYYFFLLLFNLVSLLFAFCFILPILLLLKVWKDSGEEAHSKDFTFITKRSQDDSSLHLDSFRRLFLRNQESIHENPSCVRNSEMKHVSVMRWKQKRKTKEDFKAMCLGS